MDGEFYAALSRYLLEHHRDVVVVLDKDGRVVDANKSARAGDLDITALFEARERDLRISAFVEELELSGRAFTLVASESGNVFRLEGTAVDKYRVVVAHRLTKPEESESPLGRVAASFVHDFNNLLMPILLFSGALARELGETSSSGKLAAEVHSSASLAAALARDVLALSRPRVPAIERVDVNDMLHELDRLVRRLAGPEVEVLYALDESSPLETRVDRKRLEHALLSLVVRARESMRERGQVAIATSVVRHAGAPRISLSVTDTGPGSPDAERPSALDGFDLATTSALGRGSSVTIFLEPAPPSVPAPAPPPSSGRSSTEAGRVVMLAEREEVVRRAIQRVLETHGWTVVPVGNQDEALDAARVHPLRVALVDATILRRGPTSFLHELRSLAPKARLVMLSDGVPAEPLSQSVVVLPKPFGDSDLVRALGEALGYER